MMFILQVLIIFIAVATITECASNTRRLSFLWTFKKAIKQPCSQLRKHFKLSLVDYVIKNKKQHRAVEFASYTVIAFSVISIVLACTAISSPIGFLVLPFTTKALCFMNIGLYCLGLILKHVIDCDIMNMNYNQNKVTEFIAENTITITLETAN